MYWITVFINALFEGFIYVKIFSRNHIYSNL